MSRKHYPNNTKDTSLEFDTREKHFILYLHNYSCFHNDPKEIRRAFGKARNVPSVKALEAWAEEMLSTYVKDESTFDKERILSEGFGPEAHGEEEPITRS